MAKKQAELILKVKNLATKPLQSIVTNFQKIKNIASNAGASIKSFGSSLKNELTSRMVITAGDIANGIKSIGRAVFNMAVAADEFKSVQKSFTNLAASQGQDAEAMLENMRKLSLGTVSDLELMKKANQALLLGLPVEKFGDMLTIARSASKATGESMEFMLNSIVTGLGRGSKLVLDNLGIVFKAEDANRKYAEAMGIVGRQLTETEKKQAFINEAMAVGVANADKAGSSQLDLKDQIAIANAEFQNMSAVIGTSLSPMLAFLAEKTVNVFRAMTSAFNSDAYSGFFQFITNSINGLIIGFDAMGSSIGVLAAGIVESFKAAATLDLSRVVSIAKETATELGTIQDEADAKYIAGKQALNEQIAQNQAERTEIELAGIEEREAAKLEAETLAREEAALLEMEAKQAKADAEIALIGATDKKILDLNIKAKKEEIKNATTHDAKTKAMKDLTALTDKKRKQALKEFEEKNDAERLAGLKSFLSKAATLQNSGNRALMLIGKAAAIAQITISTSEAMAASYAWGMKYGGPAGPALGSSMAGIMAIAGAAQIAQVAGVQLAEGGIVQASAGGTQATIGEGGRDEAVIPLPDDFDPDSGGGVGGGVTIIVNGGLLGDPASAREFALAVDEQLTELRRNNESNAFDQDII